MTEFRDHKSILIEEFNGLWKRGGADSCPQDHFPDCNNVQFIQSGFKTRDGIEPYIPIPNIVRMYTYTKQTGQSILCLDTSGRFWDSDYPLSPILTVATATDFGFVAYAGRAYITPCDGNTGIQNEFIYVYKGDGTAAYKAAGAKPVSAPTVANSGSAGNVEAGIHIFALVYETDTGFLTAIGPAAAFTCHGSQSVNVSGISATPGTHVTKIHVVATKLIQPAFYTGDTTGYQFFFVPGAVVNSGTTSLTVSFFDVELLEDASYLLDMLEELPASAGLGIYHNRLVAWAEYANPSLIRISVAGEPEALNAVDGIVTFPLDGNPVTAVQEYRDVMYAFKKAKTNAWTDNGDVPSSWAMSVLDQGTGCSLHGVATVLDSQGVNIDYLILCDLSGIMLFDGTYHRPELSWKIKDLWLALDTTTFSKLQALNDSINQVLYFLLNDGTMLIGDYSNGLDFKNIRWSPWTFNPYMTCIALVNSNTLALGAKAV